MCGTPLQRAGGSFGAVDSHHDLHAVFLSAQRGCVELSDGGARHVDLEPIVDVTDLEARAEPTAVTDEEVRRSLHASDLASFPVATRRCGRLHGIEGLY